MHDLAAQVALDEARKSFVELSVVLDKATDEAIALGAVDMLKSLRLSKAAVDRGAPLLMQIQQILGSQ